MANEEQLAIIKQGVKAWNLWEVENPDAEIDLSRADLHGLDLRNVALYRANLERADLRGTDMRGADLRESYLWTTALREALLYEADLSQASLGSMDLHEVDLHGCNLSGAYLSGVSFREAILSEAVLCQADLRGATLYKAKLQGANLQGADLRGCEVFAADSQETYINKTTLSEANLSGADLSQANLYEVDLRRANLHRAILHNTDLHEADLTEADFSAADLSGSDLRFARLISTNFEDANLSNCSIYGISAWNLRLVGAIQSNLVISNADEATITADTLEVAQFLHLLLKNAKLRDVIDTITSKVVLILGRFTPERKIILDAIRQELRKHNYLPVLFDFDKPDSRNLTETVSTLAHIARFVIADITAARSIAQELTTIVPHLPSVPIQPLLDSVADREYGMFEDFKNYPWVLNTYQYRSLEELLPSIEEKVIGPVEARINKARR